MKITSDNIDTLECHSPIFGFVSKYQKGITRGQLSDDQIIRSTLVLCNWYTTEKEALNAWSCIVREKIVAECERHNQEMQELKRQLDACTFVKPRKNEDVDFGGGDNWRECY